MADIGAGGDAHKIILGKILEDRGPLATRTDLTDMQIEHLNKSEMLGEIFHIPVVRIHNDGFMRLRISKDRKSRSEYIDAIKSKMTEALEKVKDFKLLG